jgi:predicted nucleic acid-binding Zn ribbon protein
MNRWAETALAEWRRYREPADHGRRTTALGEALRKCLPKLGLGDALDEAAVRRAWAGIVGPFIALQAVPDRIRGGVLFVKVHQSSVRFELERMWKAEIGKKLAAEFGAGKIREVRFIG